MYSKVLVPLDGSERAEAILPHVIDLAQRYDAEVVLLQVTELPRMRFADPIDTRLLYEELDQRMDAARAYLAEVQARLAAEGIACRYIVADGPVVDAIVNTARDENADLIALASHGRTGLRRVFYGSVAAGVLHRVDRPLLLVRAEE